jgi:hypothetical protein
MKQQEQHHNNNGHVLEVLEEGEELPAEQLNQLVNDGILGHLCSLADCAEVMLEEFLALQHQGGEKLQTQQEGQEGQEGQEEGGCRSGASSRSRTRVRTRTKTKS